MISIRRITNIFKREKKNFTTKLVLNSGIEYDICLTAFLGDSDIPLDIRYESNPMSTIIILFTIDINIKDNIPYEYDFKTLLDLYGFKTLRITDFESKHVYLYISGNILQLARLTTANPDNIRYESNPFIKYIDFIYRHDLDMWNPYNDCNDDSMYDEPSCTLVFPKHESLNINYDEYKTKVLNGTFTSNIEILGFSWIDDEFIQKDVSFNDLANINSIWISIGTSLENEFSFISKYSYIDEDIDRVLIKTSVSDFLNLLNIKNTCLDNSTIGSIYGILQNNSTYFDTIIDHIHYKKINDEDEYEEDESYDENIDYYKDIDEEV